MHRSTKLKFSDAKQAREIYNYKNIKRKLYRRNAAIWYNKIRRQKQLTPAYINIRIKGKTHVPVAAVLVLNTPDDGRLRPKHVEWLCRNETCTVLHQVGVSFDFKYHAVSHSAGTGGNFPWVSECEANKAPSSSPRLGIRGALHPVSFTLTLQRVYFNSQERA